MRKLVFGHMLSAKDKIDLHCPLKESLNTRECMNGEQKLGLFIAHAQVDLNLRILRMPEGIISFDSAH